MAASEASRWIQAAQTDLGAAQSLLDDGYYHHCAFHAQQAAEKALKGLLRFLGRVPWGHSCYDLLTESEGLLPAGPAVSPDLFDSAQRLDGHYIPSRYPDAFPVGVPADHYDEPTARQALDDASAIVAFARSHVP